MKIFFSFLLIFFSIVCFGQYNVDSLMNLERSSSGAMKASLQNKLALSFRKNKDFAKSAEWALKAIETAKAAGSKTEELSALMHAGYAYYFQKSYDKSADNFEKALKKYEEAGIKDGGYAKLLDNLAMIYRSGNKPDKAIPIYERILKITEGTGNKNAIADVNENLGISYDEKKNYSKAIEYFKKAQSLYESTGNSEGIASELNYIGISYYNFGNHDEALNNLNKALAIAKNKYQKLAGEILANLETIKLVKDNKSNLTQYDKETKEKELQKINEITQTSSHLKLENEKKESELNQLSTENVKKEKELLSGKDKITSLLNEKAETVLELNLQKELVKQQTELAKQQADLVKQQRFLIYGGVIVLGIILMFSLLLFRQFRLTKKANVLLSVQNDEILKQKNKIEAQSVELAKLSIVASKTDNAVMIMDAVGNFEWLNDGFKRLYGYSLDDFKKTKCLNLKQYSQHATIADIVDNCISEKKTIMYESQTKTTYGHIVWTQTALTPILNDLGEVDKIVAIDSDITKIKQAEKEVQLKNTELEEKNLLITDSINYAKTIQEAILPKEKLIRTFFPDFFIYYKPRDIVSGDFYWFGELDSILYFAVVDCTGHGVPGGFMSMIGNTLLNEIILEKRISSPANILNELNSKVISVLNKESNIITHQEDGMDISVCRIDKQKKEIQIALANHTAFIVTESDTIVVEGDIYAIGEILTQRVNYQYLNQVFSYQPGTTLFMFSDGFKDQFGGADNRKFSLDRMQQTLEAGRHMTMDEVNKNLESVFLNWKKDEPQLDDILVTGIKL